MSNQAVIITVGVVNINGGVAFEEWVPCWMDKRTRYRVDVVSGTMYNGSFSELPTRETLLICYDLTIVPVNRMTSGVGMDGDSILGSPVRTARLCSVILTCRE